jgi:hypothetical protein
VSLTHSPRIIHGYGLNYTVLNSTIAGMEQNLVASLGNIDVVPSAQSKNFAGGCFNRILMCSCSMNGPGEALVVYSPQPLITNSKTALLIPVSGLSTDMKTVVEGRSLFYTDNEVEEHNYRMTYISYISIVMDKPLPAYWWWQCFLPRKGE